MIEVGSNETRYEKRDSRAATPSNTSLLATAPPSSLRASKTRT